MPEYKLIPIAEIIEPEIAARAAMDTDKLNELRDSIAEIGFIHPLAVVPHAPLGAPIAVVTPRGKRRAATPAATCYEIVDGHRRYKAATMLQLTVLPCMVFADKDTAGQAVKLHANLYREDLSAAEEAAFLAELLDKYDYTEEALCKTVRQSPYWVNARLDLLRGDKNVFQALADRKINLNVAQMLNRVKDEAHCKYLLAMTIEGGATATTVAKWVAEWKSGVAAAEAQSATPTAAVAAPIEEVKLPECILCRHTHNPYHFLPALVHDYCKVSMDASLSEAAQLAAPAAESRP